VIVLLGCSGVLETTIRASEERLNHATTPSRRRHQQHHHAYSLERCWLLYGNEIASPPGFVIPLFVLLFVLIAASSSQNIFPESSGSSKFAQWLLV